MDELDKSDELIAEMFRIILSLSLFLLCNARTLNHTTVKSLNNTMSNPGPSGVLH